MTTTADTFPDLLTSKIFFILAIFGAYQIFVSAFLPLEQEKALEINTFNLENYNILFIENKRDRKVFNVRQMCAIESAAKNNPNARVRVYSLSSTLKPGFLKSKYKNVELVHFKPEDIFSSEKELKEFWERGDLNKSRHSMAHLSDLLRLNLLWQHSGIYLDLDTITLKSFQPLFELNKNGAGYFYDSFDNINNAILLFSREQHPLLKAAINKFVRYYYPYHWEYNGPILFKKTILEFCNIRNFLSLELLDFKPAAFSSNTSHPCRDLVVFPERFFNTISHVRDEHVEALKPNSAVDNFQLYDRLRDAYVVHYFNKLTDIFTTKLEDNSFMGMLVEKHCEHTSSYMRDNDIAFS